MDKRTERLIEVARLIDTKRREIAELEAEVERMFAGGGGGVTRSVTRARAPAASAAPAAKRSEGPKRERCQDCPAPPVAGKARCAAHLERSRLYYQKHYGKGRQHGAAKQSAPRATANGDDKPGGAAPMARSKRTRREVELASTLRDAIARGDVATAKRVRDEFIEMNMGLIWMFARKFLPRARGNMTAEDLVQEGVVGMMTAIDKYDERLGYRFSTYAGWWLRQAMERAICDTGETIRVSVNTRENMVKGYKASQRLTRQLGREPSLEEVAAEIGCNPQHLAAGLNAVHRPMPLDAPLRDKKGWDSASTLADILPDTREAPADEDVITAEREELVRETIGILTEREAFVIRGKYDDQRTLKDLGDEMGLSRERARQIEQQALGRMRDALEKRAAKDWTGRAAA